MKDIEQEIREALRADEAELLDEVGGEPSLLEQVQLTFRTRNRGLVALTFASGLVFFALAVLSATRFYAAEAVREQILWGAATFYALLIVLGIKVWYWMELNRAALLRELKRLELQLALLGRRLPEA